MRHKILASAVATALVGFVPSGAASAQAQETTAPDTRPSITVMAPRSRETGKTYTGIPIETLTAQSRVYIDDLNLRTEAGRNELGDRVQAAARSACEWLDEVYPLSSKLTGDNECVKGAVARAQDQVDAAIANTG
jgi:UrcA family protein